MSGAFLWAIVFFCACSVHGVTLLLYSGQETCFEHTIESTSDSLAISFHYRSNFSDRDEIKGGRIHDLKLKIIPPHGLATTEVKFAHDRPDVPIVVKLKPVTRTPESGLYAFGQYQYCFYLKGNSFLTEFFKTNSLIEEMRVNLTIGKLSSYRQAAHDERVMQLAHPGDDSSWQWSVSEPSSLVAERHQLAKIKENELDKSNTIDSHAIKVRAIQLNAVRDLLRSTVHDALEMVEIERAFRSTSESTFTRVWAFSVATILSCVVSGVLFLRGAKMLLKAKKIA